MPARLDYDRIAATIHEHYRALNPSSPYPDFDELPEFLKADNRHAAMRIGSVLAIAGLRLERREGQAWSEADRATIRRQIEDNLTLLAETEHDGWVAARIRDGWTLGDRKDLDARQSHLLVSYGRLRDQIARKQAKSGPAVHDRGPRAGQPMSVDEEVEAEKEKDRDSVRAYVDIIAGTDYRIVQES